MKADKGAAALGFCPLPHPPGVFQAKACSLLKKKKSFKKALKESYRQLPKKKKINKKTTHTKSKPFSHLPSRLPPTQVSCFHFFLLKILPATSPSGKPRV